MKPISRIEDLPDCPDLTGTRYRPRVPHWRDVRWSLRGIAPEPEADYLDLAPGRPAVLLLGCSYVAGDTLPAADRLLAHLRGLLPGAAVTSLAAAGGGLLTNLAHIGQYLPADYHPCVVVLSPSQSFRQYIPESTDEFNATPYTLWRQYYFVHAHSGREREAIAEELLWRDLLRLEYLIDRVFPMSSFLLTLWDSAGTKEVTLISPQERLALEEFAAARPDRCRVVAEREEMIALYREHGPFYKNHPCAAQTKRWAERCAEAAQPLLKLPPGT